MFRPGPGFTARRIRVTSVDPFPWESSSGAGPKRVRDRGARTPDGYTLRTV